MKSRRIINIPNLYRVRKTEYSLVFNTLISAFSKYPKLLTAFPNEAVRHAAIEATIRYYGSYDLYYGSAFSLDKNINEVAVLVHSDDMKYSLFRHLLAGSYNKDYRYAMKRMSKSDRKKRIELFDELDRLEATVDIQRPHIYMDFLGTNEKYQRCGRGRKLMEAICDYANSINLPIMLFTNTDYDISFYQSLGFVIIGETFSDKFEFRNTYMMYYPR